MLSRARALLRLAFPSPPAPLTRGDALRNLETVEFLAKSARQHLHKDEAERFESNVRYAIEQLEELERRFDARG